MAYTNVTPPELPEYNTEIYPYAVLVFNYALGQTDWYQTLLYYSDTPFTYDTEGGCITNTGTVYARIYGTDAESWTDEVTVEDTITLSAGRHDGVYQRIWTDHDILDSEGNVYLAAGEVTPVEEDETEETTKWTGLKSWLAGFVLGLAGKPLPLEVKREPVAYLYNGVALPKLPEWDRETYPYAYVAVNDSAVVSGAKFYIFYAVQEAAIYRSNSYGTWWSIAAGKRLHATFTDYTDTTMPDSQWSKWWSDIAESDSDNGTVLGYEDGSGAYGRSVVWCNTDMVRPDGTVFLEATEPIPVYE